jgi:single-strand selective monofunctional uracil DNA glycosylase
MPDLRPIARALSDRLATLRFGAPVAAVYDPVDYAWAPHSAYLERFASAEGRVVLLGMNPGPFGMAQTGVPFGDVAMVRDWMGITGEVRAPAAQHPKRPVLGFANTRSEGSGRRLWGWARDRYETAEAFFARYAVLNYCPLCFLDEGGRNVVPEALAKAERVALAEACDAALRDALRALAPRAVVGVGTFAEAALRRADPGCPVGRILHPSPASPAANRGWAAQAEAELAAMGLDGVP